MATAPAPLSGRRRPVVNRPDRLDLRIKPEVRSLIDEAAKASGKNRQEFILDAAKSAAEVALLDRRTISLESDAYKAFVALLEAPAQPNENLRKSLTTPAIWT